ncbi:MAG: PAC2 family protein, partial [Nanoarchaeota archaeon]|nr:PAC2 family protein [Nanoarchaeota archaeon]
ESLDATKIASFFSYDLPNSVFVTENNLVELPSIELYGLTYEGNSFLLLTGDAQPSLERSSYELTLELLSLAELQDVKEIITLGGIGLNEMPDQPKIYCAANKEGITKKYEDLGVNNEVYGVVGPIVGISGLLLGLSEKIDAVALLGETFGHPMYIGLKEAKEMLLVLDKLFSFKLDFSDLDEEIAAVQEEMQDKEPKKASKKLGKLIKYQDMSYIG